mmetsp:Transcript_22185/g.46375  ORF Transcript_22185/g.46375 Transcript_22185/m.46375 type:complete len:375 (-) Transcript_22185:430-1554(-)
MRDTVGVHDLGTTKLILRCVHFLSKEFVQGTITSQEHGSLFHLNNTLTKANKVGPNSNTAACHIAQSENFIISPRCFSSNLSASLEILDTNALSGSNDVLDGPAFRNLLDIHSALRQRLVHVIGEVQVFESLRWARLINKFDLELWLEVINETNSGTRVACNVDTGELVLAGIFGCLEEHIIFRNTERPTLHSHIIGNEHNLATLGVFRSLHLDNPCNHANLVGANLALAKDELSVLTLKKLLRLKEISGRTGGIFEAAEVGVPFLDQANLEEAKEVVCVGGSNTTGNGALGLDNVGSIIRVKNTHSVLAFSNDAEFTGDTSDGIGAFNIGSSLEPFTLHGRGDEADRHNHGVSILVDRLHTNLRFDFIHIQFQ